MKNILLCLVLCCVYTFSFGQQDEVKITLRDYHSASITTTVASKKYPYFFTADESGKILAYSTESKRVVKTLRPASGIPVKSMRLTNDDRVLTINQKFNFSDGKTDSIFSISVFDQKVLMQNAANIEFVGSQDDAILIRDTNADKSLNIIDVYDKNFEKITRFYASNSIDKAAYNLVSGEIVMVQKRGLTQLNILFLYKNDYKKKLNIDIPESLEIIKLFYHADDLYVLSKNKEAKIIEIYNLSKVKDFTKPVHKVAIDFNASINVDISHKNEILQLVITEKYGFSTKPLIIKKNGNIYKDQRPNANDGVTTSVYLEDKNEHLFFESFNPNFSSYIRFKVFDNETEKIVKTIPKEVKPYYHGSFLPNDSWIVIGSEISTGNFGIGQQEYQLKYYESGTFYNRFGKLDYNNLMETKFGIKDFSNKEFDFNKYTSIHPFYGSKNRSEFEADYGFYAYDLMKDKVQLISNLETNKRNVVDYNSVKRTLLLSQRPYYNGGHTEPQEFALLKNDDIINIEGLYKFGKFSEDGQYVLLISNLNEVSIRLVETMKILHSETLIDGKYKIFSDQSNEFLVSNAFWKIDKEKCNTNSIGFSMDSNHKVTSQKTECLNVLDFDSVENITVLSIEYLGLTIGDKLYKFPSSEFPTRVSLNSDGSKLMASFNNGKIKIYQTKGLKLLAEMLHPDKSSHVFVDSNNNYFSNVNPDEFVLASLNGKSSPVKDFEERFFKPEEVLKSFGMPNKEYISTLKKALALKQKNQFDNTEVNIDNESTLSSEKGDLFLLSVGVSDYLQTDYNLTFADKDALDISRIYGSLSKDDEYAYNKKFFGSRYSLEANSGEVVNELKRYGGLYTITGDLYALNEERTLWLEHDYGKYNLWNYKTGTIEPITMPKGFIMETLSYNNAISIHPDGTGFYIISDDDVFYQYKFSSKKFSVINLPFDDYASISRSALKPVIDNKWAYFSYKTEGLDNYVEIVFGETDKKEIDGKIKFSLDNFESLNESGKRQKDSANIYLPSLKALSANGRHMLYSSFDSDLFYVDLNTSPVVPLKLNLSNFDKYDMVYISNDASQLSIYRTSLNSSEREILTYNLDGKLVRSDSFDINVKGFSGYNNDLFWIRSSDPLVKEDYFKRDSLLAYNKPASFKKTRIKYLTNAEATSENIKKELNGFFKNVKPNDQVIVFLAGHGVLDEDLNYYFAPHDMVFNDVKQKGVSFNTIIENLKKANSNNIMLLMDSCHSGNTLDIDTKTVISEQNINKPNQRGSKSRRVNSKSEFKVSDVISDLFEDFLSKSGITVISASSGEDVAYENKTLGNGAFTSAYIKTLKGRLSSSGFLLNEKDLKKSLQLTDDTISELLKRVMLLTNGKQTPDLRELNAKSQLKMW
ncbi:caspase domain-containing protein [Winogradskyella sp. PG-2]|uniref:caspase family protein n=1 Tax=Winogradskyella sp. PG-2 TaxID=754409 RepID=UPI0011865AD7|nr:caspase family protein [Winogradskyella sp. PG-2]